MPELPEVEAWVRELDPLVSRVPVERTGLAQTISSTNARGKGRMLGVHSVALVLEKVRGFAYGGQRFRLARIAGR